MPISTPLLKTKFYIPTQPDNVVTRPGLGHRLEAQSGGRLTLVAAPAGFGKTTLIGNWARNVQHPVAWVSLDETDNDPALFWAYIIGGLQDKIPEQNGNHLGQIDFSPNTPTRTLLVYLINTLTEIDETIALVLDDYQVISNPHIHDDLSYLIDNQPNCLHLVLVTRADPPLPIARLRVSGLLTEFRAEDLRFTLAEAEKFLNEVMGLELTHKDIVALMKRTEGWIVGLRLAALSMQGHNDKSAFVSTFSGGHHYILEYLTDEVVNGLPEMLRIFVLKTSILERLCAPLCDAILDREGSSEVLAGLHRENLFITSQDDDHCWFRYNRLFSDLLGNLLRREFAPEYIYNLHLKASEWYEGHGYLTEAIEHTMQAQAYERAAMIIENVASGTMLHGQLTTLLHWLDALPESMLVSRPRLRFYQAWALSLSGQPQKAEKLLLEARSSLEQLPESPENHSLRGELAALLTGIITYYNDPPRVIREAQEALTYLTKENLISRARVLNALGTAYAYSGAMDKAIQAYEEARELALKAKNPFLASVAIEMLAGMQIYHLGNLREAVRNLEQILELGRSMDSSHQAFTGTAHILLAEINLEWNNLDTAANYLENGMRLIREGGIGYSLTHAYCTSARFRLALGDTQGAFEVLRAAQQAADSAHLMHIVMHNLACQVKWRLHLGDFAAASQRMEENLATLNCGLAEKLPLYLCEIQQISLARINLAQGNLKKTIETLDDIFPQVETAGRMAHVLEACLLKALALQEQEEMSLALESLDRALSWAVREGYIRTFLEGGTPVYNLLKLAESRGGYPQYVGEILAAFGEPVKAIKPPVLPGFEQSNQDSWIEPLSPRECEVLRLIAAGYTNQQIAQELVVSLNTVKKHTSNIYSKLGVKNRTQAITRGRELDVISG